MFHSFLLISKKISSLVLLDTDSRYEIWTYHLTWKAFWFTFLGQYVKILKNKSVLQMQF